MEAGTALGEAGEVRLDTIRLQRGDMLLMLATSRHHEMLVLLDSKDGLQGALFNLWTPNAKYRHHQRTTTHLDPSPPPLEVLALLGMPSLDYPSVDQALWVAKGAGGREGFLDGGCCPSPLRRHP